MKGLISQYRETCSKGFARLRADVYAWQRHMRHNTHLFDGNDEIHFGMGGAVELAECLLFGPVIPVFGSQSVIDIFT